MTRNNGTTAGRGGIGARRASATPVRSARTLHIWQTDNVWERGRMNQWTSELIDDGGPDAIGTRMVVEPDGDPRGGVIAAVVMIARDFGVPVGMVLRHVHVCHDDDCPTFDGHRLESCTCAEIWVDWLHR